MYTSLLQTTPLLIIYLRILIYETPDSSIKKFVSFGWDILCLFSLSLNICVWHKHIHFVEYNKRIGILASPSQKEKEFRTTKKHNGRELHIYRVFFQKKMGKLLKALGSLFLFEKRLLERKKKLFCIGNIILKMMKVVTCFNEILGLILALNLEQN